MSSQVIAYATTIRATDDPAAAWLNTCVATTDSEVEHPAPARYRFLNSQ
jgi:hypothetical protein